MFSFILKKCNLSVATLAIYLFILIVNQSLLVNSFRLMQNDIDQYDTDDGRRDLSRRANMDNLLNFDNLSPVEVQNLVMPDRPSHQRRFCCMSPLSGRKRSIRALLRGDSQK